MLVLVTGARGAIGRHVVAQARTRGWRVVGLGHGEWGDAPDFPPLDGWHCGAVSANALAAVAAEYGAPDAVVHLAGGSLVGASISDPDTDFELTVGATRALLGWMREAAPAAKLVFASSAAVYGAGPGHAVREDAPITPVSPYGAHKAAAELLIGCHARQYGLNAAIIRLFSVYGPGLRKQLVFELNRKLAQGERSLRLDGTGMEQRDFLYIADAANMLLDAVALAGIDAPVFNGGGGRATTVRELAELITQPYPGVDIAFSGYCRPGDPVVLVGDDRAATSAGLRAPTSLAIGLAQTRIWLEGGTAC